MIHEFLSRQFFIFLLTGGTAAAVNFSSRILFNQWVGFSLAIILAYITGMITAFLLAKIFVFKESKQNIHHSLFFFCLVNLAAIIQTWVISMWLAYYFLPAIGLTEFVFEVAHVIGIAIPVFTSYIGHKRWSFR